MSSLQQPTKTTYHNNLLVYSRPRDPTTRELEAFYQQQVGSIVIHSVQWNKVPNFITILLLLLLLLLFMAGG